MENFEEMNVRDYIDISIGEFLGLITAIIIVVVVIYRRFRALSSIDFKLKPPEIPRVVLVSIKTAEAEYYGAQPRWRRTVESLQDFLTFISPALVYKLNFSVGRYRIKPHTIDDLIDWAVKSDFLEMHSEHDKASKSLIAYFSHQPAINDWQISIYLERLRLDHPMLRNSNWSEIGASDRLIAKLYSGYMGAGGDWEAWKSNESAGAESKKRFHYDEESGQYRLIQHIRSQFANTHDAGVLAEVAD